MQYNNSSKFQTLGGLQSVLVYQWLEDSLSSGKLVSEDLYPLKLEAEKSSSDYVSSDDEKPKPKKRRSSSPGDELVQTSIPKTHEAPNKDQVAALESTVPYSPPDLNRNITEIFGKLINIYRGGAYVTSICLLCTLVFQDSDVVWLFHVLKLKPWVMTEDHLAITRL